MNGGMSAIGTKRTSAIAQHMSAFGGRADNMSSPNVSRNTYSHPEILAYEAVMVATLRLPLIYLPRYSISHIETKSDCALSERRAGRLRRRWRPDLLRG